MSSILNEGDLAHEVDLVWLEPLIDLDYVRQALDKTRHPSNQPPYARHGRMVGYACLDARAKPDPDSGLFTRRVFYLLPHDRDSTPQGIYGEGAPSEAVDPRTIKPHRAGSKTLRSQTGIAAAPAL